MLEEYTIQVKFVLSNDGKTVLSEAARKHCDHKLMPLINIFIAVNPLITVMETLVP